MCETKKKFTGSYTKVTQRFTTYRPQSSSVTTMASGKLEAGSFDPYFRLVEMFLRCLDRGSLYD